MREGRPWPRHGGPSAGKDGSCALSAACRDCRRVRLGGTSGALAAAAALRRVQANAMADITLDDDDGATRCAQSVVGRCVVVERDHSVCSRAAVWAAAKGPSLSFQLRRPPRAPRPRPPRLAYEPRLELEPPRVADVLLLPTPAGSGIARTPPPPRRERASARDDTGVAPVVERDMAAGGWTGLEGAATREVVAKLGPDVSRLDGAFRERSR